MPRVVCLLGSPRAKGCSDLLAARFCDAAESAGATTVRHALRDLRFQGFTPPSDSLYASPEDDLDPILADIMEAEVLVLATPIYFCDMTGLMKQAFDRFHAFVREDAATGQMTSNLGRDKTLVFIQVQSADERHHCDLISHYAPAFDMFGFTRVEHLRGCDLHETADLLAAPHLLEAAGLLATELLRPEYA
ncbi:MAG: NAD(P)H-dependent oxidoreductase [Pseudomonadota bacterium]